MLVKTIYGAEQNELEIAGKSVATVRSHLKHVLNLAETVALVNGQQVDESYILQAGDCLEFCKHGDGLRPHQGDVKCSVTPPNYGLPLHH